VDRRHRHTIRPLHSLTMMKGCSLPSAVVVDFSQVSIIRVDEEMFFILHLMKNLVLLGVGRILLFYHTLNYNFGGIREITGGL